MKICSVNPRTCTLSIFDKQSFSCWGTEVTLHPTYSISSSKMVSFNRSPFMLIFAIDPRICALSSPLICPFYCRGGGWVMLHLRNNFWARKLCFLIVLNSCLFEPSVSEFVLYSFSRYRHPILKGPSSRPSHIWCLGRTWGHSIGQKSVHSFPWGSLRYAMPPKFDIDLRIMSSYSTPIDCGTLIYVHELS